MARGSIRQLIGIATALTLAGGAVGGCRQGQNILGPGIASSLFAYVTQFTRDEVAVVDARLKTPANGPYPIKVGRGPIRMLVKPTGQQEYLYVLNKVSGTVSFVNRRSGNAEEEVSAGVNPDDFSISSDGDWLFVVSATGGTLTRINVQARTADRTVALGTGFSPIGVVANPICTKDTQDSDRDSKKDDCASVLVYIVNENVSIQQGSSTKTGQLKIVTSQATGLVDGPVVSLVGAERPKRAVMNANGKVPAVIVTDDRLANGLWKIDVSNPQDPKPQQFGASPVGLTHDAEVDDKGRVYVSMPTADQYAQLSTDGQAQIFPDRGKIRDFGPQALALNNDQSELWIGFVGSSAISYAEILTDGRQRELKSVQFSSQPEAKQPPSDIILAGGI